jgi:hypothetical protein
MKIAFSLATCRFMTMLRYNNIIYNVFIYILKIYEKENDIKYYLFIYKINNK